MSAIRTDFNVYWTAVLDSYDGAPDANGPNSLVGVGRTEQQAIANLNEQIEEHDGTHDIGE